MDAILRVQGIDMVTVGSNDWGVSLGLFGTEARAHLSPKIETVIKSATVAGKIVAMNVSSANEAKEYISLGARLLFCGCGRGIETQSLQ